MRAKKTKKRWRKIENKYQDDRLKAKHIVTLNVKVLNMPD